MQQENNHLLIVDDDASLAQMLHEFMELEGFGVDTVSTGEAALERIAASPPSLVVLDVMLPGINGFETLERIRAEHDLPVIMLTARGAESDRIHGLTAGADDYLPKPFNPVELSARIRNVLKRTNRAAESAPKILQNGQLRMDLDRCEMHVDDTPVQLTAAEMRVLEHLMRNPGKVLSRGELTRLALDRPLAAYDRSIDTLVSKLRKKLSTAGYTGNTIRNLRGHGYVLDAES